MRHLLTLGASIALATTAGAQTATMTEAARWADSVRVAVEAAHIAGDEQGLRAARAMAERAVATHPGDALLRHYEGYALYREATALFARQRLAEARPLVDRAVAALEASAKKRPMAETSALLSTLLGYQIAIDPSQAMTLGLLAGQAMDEAVSLGPTNPRVWLLRGVNALYTPEAYGGGVQAATSHLEKAVALFAGDRPAPNGPAWGRAEAHAWLGQAYHRAGDAARAEAEFRRALALEPRYAWVRTGLLPGVAKARP